VLGLIGRESRQAQRRAQIVEDLQRAAEKIDVEYVDFFGRPASAPPPNWLAKVLGEPFFQRVTAVVIGNARELPEDASVLGELKHLQTFEIGTRGGYEFTDAHAGGLAPLRRLETVSLAYTQVSDEGLLHLSLENPLRSVKLNRTLVGDEGLAHLARCRTIEELDLSETLISDEGMKHLPSLRRLKSLTLDRVMVSDAGVRQLAFCPHLESLHLQRLPLSDEAFADIAEFPALMELRIVGDKGLTHDRRFINELRTSEGRSEALEHLGPPNVFWATERSHSPRNTPYLRWLLEHGADPNEKRRYGLPVVHILVNRNAPEPVAVLVEFDADLNAADAGGRTPLAIAAVSGNLPMIRHLVRLGAKVDAPRGRSPLPHAASRGQVEALRLLLQLGADVNGVNRGGAAALVSARANPEIVELLLKAGADPNCVAAGDTALHQAVDYNRPETVRLLLDHGADPARKNRHGETPLTLAGKRQRSPELIALLKESAE
jgi:ankyrin repeat protein